MPVTPARTGVNAVPVRGAVPRLPGSSCGSRNLWVSCGKQRNNIVVTDGLRFASALFGAGEREGTGVRKWERNGGKGRKKAGWVGKGEREKEKRVGRKGRKKVCRDEGELESCAGASGHPLLSPGGSRGTSGAAGRSCPVLGGGGSGVEGGKERTNTGVACAAFFSATDSKPCGSGSSPHPSPGPSRPPALPSRSLQDHFQGKARGGAGGRLRTFPLLPPLAFFPGRERRPYLLLFSPSGRDNALIDTLFGEERISLSILASITRNPPPRHREHQPSIRAGRGIPVGTLCQKKIIPGVLPDRREKEKRSLIPPCPCAHGKIGGRGGRPPAPRGCTEFLGRCLFGGREWRGDRSLFAPGMFLA